MKKVTVVLLALLCNTFAFAQDSYRSLIEEYTNVNTGLVDTDKSLAAFRKMAEDAGYSVDNAASAAKTYYEQTMKPHIIDIMCKNFQQYLSEDELKQLLTSAKSEAGQTALKHASGIMSQEKMQKLTQDITPNLMTLFQGGTPEKVSAPNCSETYKQKFAKYDELTGTSDMITGMFDQMKQYVDQVPDGKAIFAKIQNYVNENKTNLIMNMQYPEVTEQDLDYNISLYSTTAGQHLKPALKSMMSEVVTYSLSAVQDFKDYLKK